MNIAFQRQLTQEQQRNREIRAAFINQYPSLADQLHQGEVELSCSCPLCVHIRASIADSDQVELLPEATPSNDACWFELSDLATGIVYRSALITAQEVQQRNKQLEEWGSSMEWRIRA